MPTLVGMFGVCQPRLAPTKTGCAALNDQGGRTNGPYLPGSAPGGCQPWLACSACANQGWHLPKQDVLPSTIEVCGPTVRTYPAPRLVDANLGWHVRGVPTKVGTKTGCAALNDRGVRTNGPQLPVSASGRCQPWLACSVCANQGWHLPKQDVPPSTIEVCGPTVRTCPSPLLVDANLGWHVPGVPTKVGTYQNRMCRPQRSRCADQRSAAAPLRGWWMPTWVGMFRVCQPRLAPANAGYAALNDR